MVGDYLTLYERIATVPVGVSALARVGTINHVKKSTESIGFPLRQDAA
jgi:hypothetical protein